MIIYREFISSFTVNVGSLYGSVCMARSIETVIVHVIIENVRTTLILNHVGTIFYKTR